MSIVPTMTFAVVNLAWQRDDRGREKELLDELRKHADVILAIETVDSPMKRMLGRWKVWQPQRTEGAKNNTVAVHPRVRTGYRGARVAVDPDGLEMRTRWLAWRRVYLAGAPIRGGACHRPPPRFRRLWAAFDAVVVRWLRRPTPAVLGLDANAVDLPSLTRPTGYDWVHSGIMGALVSPQLKVLRTRTMRMPASDHDILLITVAWRRNRA